MPTAKEVFLKHAEELTGQANKQNELLGGALDNLWEMTGKVLASGDDNKTGISLVTQFTKGSQRLREMKANLQNFSSELTGLLEKNGVVDFPLDFPPVVQQAVPVEAEPQLPFQPLPPEPPDIPPETKEEPDLPVIQVNRETRTVIFGQKRVIFSGEINWVNFLALAGSGAQGLSYVEVEENGARAGSKSHASIQINNLRNSVEEDPHNPKIIVRFGPQTQTRFAIKGKIVYLDEEGKEGEGGQFGPAPEVPIDSSVPARDPSSGELLLRREESGEAGLLLRDEQVRPALSSQESHTQRAGAPDAISSLQRTVSPPEGDHTFGRDDACIIAMVLTDERAYKQYQHVTGRSIEEAQRSRLKTIAGGARRSLTPEEQGRVSKKLEYYKEHPDEVLRSIGDDEELQSILTLIPRHGNFSGGRLFTYLATLSDVV